MADTNTDIYKTLGQNNQQMTPLQILQLLGQANNLKLQQQNIEANTGVTESFKQNVNPDGTLNYPGLTKSLAERGGIKAPETLNQVMSNTTGYNALRQTQQDAIQKRFGAVGSLPNPTMGDIYSAGVHAMRDNPTIPPEMIMKRIDEARSIKDPKKLKEWALTQGITAPSFEANEGLTGTPDASGAPQVVSRGARTLQQGGVAPAAPGVSVALPPGVGEASQRVGAESGALLAEHRAKNANFTREVFPLVKAIPALERLGTEGTGPGKDEINEMKSFAQSFGFAPKSWQGSINDFDEAKKYLTDWVTANTSATGTNDKLAAAFSSNASTKISNAAAVDVAKAALSLRRMQKMQTEAFDATGLPDSQYSKWASQWNAKQDPRVFGFDLMNPDQRKRVLKDLPPAKRDLFMLDVERAEQSGVLSPPGK